MLEKNVVKIVKKIALDNNYMPYIVQPVAGSSGVPDCILLAPDGSTLFLEIKADSKLRPAQELFLAKCKEAYKCQYDRKKGKCMVTLRVFSGMVVDLDTFLKYYQNLGD